MLFTPSTSSFSSQPISSTVKTDSSTPTPNSQVSSVVDDRRSLKRDSFILSTTKNLLNINGPTESYPLSDKTRSPVSDLSSTDWFDSNRSFSPRPRINSRALTATSVRETHFPTSGPRRRVSCPVRHSAQRDKRFRLPNLLGSSTGNAVMTSPSNISTNDNSTQSFKEATRRPSTTFLPVANPVAAAALIEGDELLQSHQIHNESNKSTANENLHQTLTDGYVNNIPQSSFIPNKAILNVGGVRHEGLIKDGN